MRHDVIDHVRRRHDSALQTDLTQRMLYQLQLAQPSPTRSFIEVLPRNGVTANSRHFLMNSAYRMARVGNDIS
jgi:hypothetical protein